MFLLLGLWAMFLLSHPPGSMLTNNLTASRAPKLPPTISTEFGGWMANLLRTFLPQDEHTRTRRPNPHVSLSRSARLSSSTPASLQDRGIHDVADKVAHILAPYPPSLKTHTRPSYGYGIAFGSYFLTSSAVHTTKHMSAVRFIMQF